MIKEKRFSRILELIKQEKLVTIQDLSKQLGVSYMTITRDFEDLEARGSLQRIRGGAVSIVEPSEIVPRLSKLYDPQLDLNYTKKISIGRYAAENLINEGDYITIEAGSTASSLVPFLHQTNLTILTNGLLTSMMVAPIIHNVTLICSGGILIETGAFIGPQAEDFFSKYKVKKAFFGAEGLTVGDGFTDPTPLYTRLKHVMKQNAEKVIVMVDSSKIGVRSLVQVLSLEDVDTIITDAGAPPEIVSVLQNSGVDIRIVPD
ncbi:MAG: DeoR/GlpR family DNA-binding transcription regulator [Anaerolineaceae bacterium]|nr:DeoR/GlpR family DNA-binding transcription regulator [Anaerolineaceae bacterium]